MTKRVPDAQRKRAPGAGRPSALGETIRFQIVIPQGWMQTLDAARGERSRSDLCREAIAEKIGVTAPPLPE